MRSVNGHFRQGIWIAVAVLAMALLCSGATRLMISPAYPKQLSKSTLQFTTTLNAKGVTKLVRWSSSNPAVATIEGNGDANLLSAGASTIAATARNVTKWPSASTTLTLTTAMSPVFSRQPWQERNQHE
jgi:hypothetical protein